MLAEQAARTATGRGAARDRAGQPARGRAPPRLVLVVDQFEELFTAGADGDVDAWSGRRSSRRCTRQRHPAGPAGPAALVVAAVRADPLARLIAYPPLQAALDAGPFTVGPMSRPSCGWR